MIFSNLLLLFLIFLSSRPNIYADTECPTVLNSGQDRREDKTKLRIVQYNVEWLFVDYYAPFDCPGQGCTWKNTTQALVHLLFVSDVINTLNPDIINLCEVEGCDELNMVKNELTTANTYSVYLKKGTDTSTGQNVGLMTRIEPLISLYRNEEKSGYPIDGSKCGYTGAPGNSGVSKHYITEYSINGYKIVMIGAHLLANPTDPTRCSEREAQASVLQKTIYDYYYMDYEIIMIGDFNDFDNKILDVNSNKPTSMVLDILKGYKGQYAGKYELFSIASNISQEERYSDWWDPNEDCMPENNEFSMIDHILVTSRIQKMVKNAFIYHGYREYCEKWNSDHFPVVIDLEI
jgi:exonuclease III